MASRKIALLACGGAFIMLGSTAFAQSTTPGSPPGTTRTPPERRQSDVPAMNVADTNRVLSPRVYLNGGSYAQAAAAYEVVRLPAIVAANWNSDYIENLRQIQEEQDSFLGLDPQHAPRRVQPLSEANTNRQDQLYLSYNTAAFLQSDPWQQRPNNDAAAGLIRVLGSGAPAGPSAAAGSRPPSQLEDTQTQNLREARPAATRELQLAAELVRSAQETGNPGFIVRAQTMEAEARRHFDRLNAAIILSDSYHGRAFTNDADAMRYVEMRSTLLNEIQWAGTYERVGHQEAFTTRSAALFNEMRAAHDGTSRNLGGGANLISGTQRTRFEARLAQSRAENIAANERIIASGAVLHHPHFDSMGTPEGRTAYFEQFRNIGMYFGERPVDPLERHVSSPSPRPSGGTATPGRASGQTAARRPPPGRRMEDDFTLPRQPGGPDYPVHVRTAEERAAYDRRRAADDLQRDTLQQAVLQAEYEEASRAAAAAAARERARLDDERARLAAAAQARTSQDARWRSMVEASFRTFQSPGWERFDDFDPLRRGALRDAVWEAFNANGGNLATLQLEDIYRNYDLLRGTAIPPAMSLSSAPHSLSAVGRSLSAAGTPVRSGTDDYNDPAVQSLYEALYGLTQRRRGPLGPSEDEIQVAKMGNYDLSTDPNRRWGRETGGYVAASLFSEEVDYLQRSFVNGRNGLNGLLAQPFNVLLTWGEGSSDLDLHMTGPTGARRTDRFHIFFDAKGKLESFPFAALIRDCICRSGSEVVLTSNLLGGGVYRVSVFNFGDPSANSNNLSNQSNARIQIVRGGVAVPQGNGTTIQGGRLILDSAVPVGQPGNTWVAVELDPSNGRITVPRAIQQSEDSAHVR